MKPGMSIAVFPGLQAGDIAGIQSIYGKRLMTANNIAAAYSMGLGMRKKSHNICDNS